MYFCTQISKQILILIQKRVNMKKVLAISLFLLFSITSFGQVKITTQAEKQVEKNNFDHSKNWQGEQYRNYIGQSLYVVPKSELLVKYGYSNFYTTPNGETYQPISSFLPNTKHEALANKTLTVEDVIIDGIDYMGNPNIYLKLSLDNETIYYKYDLRSEAQFPFLVMGYFDKLKNDYIDKKSVLLKCADTKLSDYITGKEVLLIPNTIWTCSDIVLDTKYYNLMMIFTNAKGETICNEANRYNLMFISLKEKNRLESIYGKELVLTAIKGNIKIGMHKELVKVALGEPLEINSTSYNEQWVYDERYVYLKNGKVTGWN